MQNNTPFNPNYAQPTCHPRHYQPPYYAAYPPPPYYAAYPQPPYSAAHPQPPYYAAHPQPPYYAAYPQPPYFTSHPHPHFYNGPAPEPQQPTPVHHHYTGNHYSGPVNYYVLHSWAKKSDYRPTPPKMKATTHASTAVVFDAAPDGKTRTRSSEAGQSLSPPRKKRKVDDVPELISAGQKNVPIAASEGDSASPTSTLQASDAANAIVVVKLTSEKAGLADAASEGVLASPLSLFDHLIHRMQSMSTIHGLKVLYQLPPSY